MIYFGSVSVNYERMITEHLAFRTGLGYGLAFSFSGKGGTSAIGSVVMLHYLTSGSNHKLEAGAGASVVYLVDDCCGYYALGFQFDHGELSLVPAIALGYRYQQQGGGFFFRAGVTYTYFMGTPIQISAGLTF